MPLHEKWQEIKERTLTPELIKSIGTIFLCTVGIAALIGVLWVIDRLCGTMAIVDGVAFVIGIWAALLLFGSSQLSSARSGGGGGMSIDGAGDANYTSGPDYHSGKNTDIETDASPDSESPFNTSADRL